MTKNDNDDQHLPMVQREHEMQIEHRLKVCGTRDCQQQHPETISTTTGSSYNAAERQLAGSSGTPSKELMS